MDKIICTINHHLTTIFPCTINHLLTTIFPSTDSLYMLVLLFDTTWKRWALVDIFFYMIFFFFFGKKGISIKKLNSPRLNRAALAWIQPSKIRIENSKQIHRRIFKQNKISILLSSLPSKMVSDSICFSLTMFESNLWDLTCQLPAVIQQRGDKRVWVGGFHKDVYNSFCIQLNFNGWTAFFYTNAQPISQGP